MWLYRTFLTALFIASSSLFAFASGGGGGVGQPLSCDGTNCTLASGQLRLPDGTAAAPPMARSADPSTGTYFPDALSIGFTIQGTPRVAVTGTSSPTWDLRLAVTSSLSWSTTTSPVAAPDVFLSRSAAGHLKVTTDSTTLATFSAAKFTTTGVGTYPITLNGGERVGVNGGPSIVFNAQTLTFSSAGASPTSGSASNDLTGTFTPPSGSASYAALHVNPTINGTSSGIAYGVVVANKTNTLTGGTIKLLSLGTTTTDAFTGYTEKFALDVNGVVTMTNGAATITATKTVRAAGGAADCTLIFTGGVLTGGTC